MFFYFGRDVLDGGLVVDGRHWILGPLPVMIFLEQVE